MRLTIYKYVVPFDENLIPALNLYIVLSLSAVLTRIY
jgi:hypothetical protein